MKKENPSALKEKIRQLEKRVKQLEKANSLYQNLVEGLPLQMMIYDSDGYLIASNSSGSRPIQSVEDLQEESHNVLKGLKKKDPEAAKKYEKAYKGEIYKEDFDELPDQSGKVFRKTIFPVKSADGKVKYVFEVKEDVTEIKKEERAHQATIKSFKNFYENAPLPFQSLDKDGHFLEVNPAWLNTLGYRKEEVINHSFTEFLHPESVSVFQKNFPEFKKRGVVHDVNFKMKHKKGHYIDVSFEGCIGHYADGSFKQTYCVFKDVTLKKKIEDQLKRNEEKYRKIFHNIPVMIHSIDKGGRLIDVSNHWLEQSGYTRDEVIGKKSTEFLTDESARYAKEVALPEFFRKGYARNVPYQFVKKNGEVMETLLSAISERDKNGNFVRSYAVFYDVTEEKRIEKALEESERKYRTIVENINDAMIIHDTKGIITFVNDYACEMLGYRCEEILGMRLDAIHTPQAQPVIKNLIEKESWEKRILVEQELLTKDGVKIPVEVSSNVVEFNGNREIHAFFRNISDRKGVEEALKESEEKFFSLFSAAPDAALLASAETGVIVDANQAAANLFEKPIHEIIGMHQKELHPKNLKKQSQENFENRKVFSETEISPIESRIITNSGKGKDVEIRGKIIIIQNKQFVLGTFRDITARKRAEHDLRKSEQMLRELNATKDTFFSIISHDLRNPFNTILGFSQLALDKIKKEQYKDVEKYCFQIYKSTRHSYNLLNNLLHWSRIQRGKMEFNPETLFVENVIEQATQQVAVNMEEKDQRLDISAEPGLKVYADAFMLETILRNLLSNAIKYSPDGKKINLKAFKHKGKIKISVKDEGIGMDKHVLDQVFNIEKNFSTKGTRKEEGTGLGLILCKEFAETHGGSIEVDSEGGKGSLFTVSLPAKLKAE